MADPVAGIAGSAAKSVRPFRSSEAYVEAMKEDLAEWLNALYGLGLPSGGDGFLTGLAIRLDLNYRRKTYLKNQTYGG